MKYLESDQQEIKAFVDSIDCFLLDCDGVLWHGNTLIPKVKETLNLLHSLGKKLLFVTNNSTKSREGYLEKFYKLGFEWVTSDMIISSSYSAAYYLKHCANFPSTKRVYVVGERGITAELENHGIQWCGSSQDDSEEKVSYESMLEGVNPDNSIGAVLVGFDRAINYRKIAKAMCFVVYNGAEFYATNDDATFPSFDRAYPGTGTIVAAVETAVGRKAKVLGKPHQPMMDAIMKGFNLDKKRTCMVGDRLNTDIAFGLNGGLHTLLVLTGVTKKEELRELNDSEKPEFVVDGFSSLFLE